MNELPTCPSFPRRRGSSIAASDASTIRPSFPRRREPSRPFRTEITQIHWDFKSSVLRNVGKHEASEAGSLCYVVVFGLPIA
jgi:hypothetical protein